MPWKFSVDTFAVGCVIAEVYLSRELLPREAHSDQERLAIVDKVLGPFPDQYAREIEHKFLGTFTFGPCGPTVVYTPEVSNEAEEGQEALLRLEELRPLSVCVSDIVSSD